MRCIPLTQDVKVVVLAVECVARREGVLRLEDLLRRNPRVIVANPRQRPGHLQLVLVAEPPYVPVDGFCQIIGQ